jgi:hypothetical protein
MGEMVTRLVLDRIVAHPHGGVGNAAAGSDQHYREVLVADVVTDLFVTAVEDERDDIVDKHLLPGKRQASCKADGVLLGDPHVAETVRVLLFELIEHPETGVAAQDHDIVPRPAGLKDCMYERISHVSNAIFLPRSLDQSYTGQPPFRR